MINHLKHRCSRVYVFTKTKKIHVRSHNNSHFKINATNRHYLKVATYPINKPYKNVALSFLYIPVYSIGHHVILHTFGVIVSNRGCKNTRLNMCRSCCSSRMVLVWTVVAGLLFAGSMVLAFWGMSRIIDAQVNSQTSLQEGTEQWDRFLELPFALDYTIRFFEVNNPDDILEKGALPNLTESAPYTYKLKLKKTITSADEYDDSVTYTRLFNFEFQSLGVEKDTDEVFILNPLLMSSLQLTNTIQRLALAGCMDKILGPSQMNQVFIKKSVKEILFEGIPFAFGNRSEELGVACEIIRKRMINMTENIRVIEHVEDEDYLRLALFNYKTENYLKISPDGIYKVNRGIKDISALGTIMQWNGGTVIPTYGNSKAASNDSCQTLRGTDSTIYNPHAIEGESKYVYNTDICRTVKLTFTSSDDSYNGLKAFRYETEETFLKSSSLDPENDCFCTKATKDASEKDNCYLDGTLDYKPCIGAPALISQPHFLNADQSYINGVTGLSPDKEKHGIFLLLEPNTGTPLQGMKRIQINTVLRKEPFIKLTPRTMYDGIVPVLWLEEGFSLPQEYVDKLNNQYFKPVKIATGLKYSLIAVSAAFLVGCIYLVWRKEYFSAK